MNTQAVEQLTLGFVSELPVVVQPAPGQMSCDAGLLPVAEFERRWRYTRRMAACLESDQGQVADRRHLPVEMLRQRILGILAGYEDCNDHDTLRGDPVFKLAAGRLPQGADLASQPTLSRFENAVGPAQLLALEDFLITTGIEALKQRHGGGLPAELILDLDATDDPTHGHQQLSLFHGYFDQYQYFPLIISEPTTKHILGAWLRPGVVHAALGADDDLMRVVKALREARPDIRIHVRADAGFGVPWMYAVCEENDLSYTLGFSANPRLQAMTQGLMDQAVRQYQSTGQKQRLFACLNYQAQSWDRPRQVVAKAECHAQGTNLRFVISSRSGLSTSQDGQGVYDRYIQRGESEHRMDELKNGLGMDRLSCHRFMANFFRLLLHALALNLLSALRQSQELPEVLQVAQPCTWRARLIKVAATVVQSTRRVVVTTAAHWPWWDTYLAVGRRALSFQGGP